MAFKLKGNVKLEGVNQEGVIVRAVNETNNTYVGNTLTNVSGNYELNVDNDTDSHHIIVKKDDLVTTSGLRKTTIKYLAKSLPFVIGEEEL